MLAQKNPQLTLKNATVLLLVSQQQLGMQKGTNLLNRSHLNQMLHVMTLKLMLRKVNLLMQTQQQQQQQQK